MLCVHGNPTWSYLWRRFLAQAPAGWRVVAVDQLGMGWSERTEPRTLAQRVDDLGSLTAALGITGPVVTVAHDWGGPVSLGWALDHREQLRAVVLTNTAVHQPAGAAAPSLIRLARTPGLRQAICVGTPAFVRTTSALSWPALPAPVRDALAAPYASPARRRAVGDFVADIPLDPAHPSAATLDRIAAGLGALADVPVLMLWGPRDPVFSDLYLRDLLARLPHAAGAPLRGRVAPGHRGRARGPPADVWRWVGDLDGSPAARDQPEAAPGAPLWSGLTDRAGDPTPAVVELGPDRAHRVLRPAGPAGARPRRRAGRHRGAPGTPGRAARAARRRPHRRGLRLLARRRGDRGRRRGARAAGDGPGPARRRPRPRHRHRSRRWPRPARCGCRDGGSPPARWTPRPGAPWEPGTAWPTWPGSAAATTSRRRRRTTPSAPSSSPPAPPARPRASSTATGRCRPSSRCCARRTA